MSNPAHPLATAAQLPPMTPYANALREPREIVAHRKVVSGLVEIVLDGYWRDDLSSAMRTAILADWADELEDWPADSVQDALRQWRRNNPSKKPNPGHILQILNKAWADMHADQVKAVVQSMRPPAPQNLPDLSQRRAIADDLARQFPGLIKRVEPPKEQASAEDINAIQAEMRAAE